MSRRASRIKRKNKKNERLYKCVFERERQKGQGIKGFEFRTIVKVAEPREESMPPFCDVCLQPMRLCGDEAMHGSVQAKDPAWFNVVQLARWAEECEQDARAGREAGVRPLSDLWWSDDGVLFDMAEGAAKEAAKVHGRAVAVRFQAQREARLWQARAVADEKAQAKEKTKAKEKARDTAPLRLGGRGAPTVRRTSSVSPTKAKGRLDAKKKL